MVWLGCTSAGESVANGLPLGRPATHPADLLGVRSLLVDQIVGERTCKLMSESHPGCEE